MEIRELLTAHVTRFNSAIESGRFEEMVQHFADDAVMIFDGVPVGPFEGRDEILAAYAARPPDDRLLPLEVLASSPDSIATSYAWSSAPDDRAGTMTLDRKGDLITRLVVRFE